MLKLEKDMQDGNCVRACLIHLLGIEPDKIPENILDSEEGIDQLEKVMNGLGYSLLWMEPKEMGDDLMGLLKHLQIAAIQSPRYEDCYHTVIVKEGKVVFDPCKKQEGQKVEVYFYILLKSFSDDQSNKKM